MSSMLTSWRRMKAVYVFRPNVRLELNGISCTRFSQTFDKSFRPNVRLDDAHNSTLEFDTNTSLFAVYDGHCGHEVSTYSAQNLPQYLKDCEAYKKGDYTEALKDAFLGFDATLTTPEVIEVLKEIAKNKDEQNSGSGKRDSGCTAVVALLKGQELYVANAGDSRCIVCRKGQAMEMSLDHKPEDKAERKRTVKAGGSVNFDGRVNDNLNVSRALGDHAYKQSDGLSAQEQMITALPDVKTLMIDPAEDEFMVLACDGIWNSMSSQEVVDFVRPRVQEGQSKLSQICEELFDHCLAPNTLGDGTGCDNMTAVIVQFLPELANQKESNSLKQAASPAIESSSDTNKRPKMEETETATCV